MINILKKVRNTIVYTYYRLTEWSFPPNMVHTTGYKVVKGLHECEVRDAIISTLKKNAIFLDVGANVGYFSKLASGIVGDEGCVYSVEAESENYISLLKNMRKCNNVVSLNIAVSDKIEVLELHKASHSSCHSTVKTDSHLTNGTSSIPSATVDFIWDNYISKVNIDLMKVDVEGAETLVLKGAKKALDAGAIKYIIIEYCPRIMLNSGFDVKDLYQNLESGYEVSLLEKNKTFNNKQLIGNLSDFEELTNHLLSYEDAENSNLFCTLK